MTLTDMVCARSMFRSIGWLARKLRACQHRSRHFHIAERLEPGFITSLFRGQNTARPEGFAAVHIYANLLL